MRAGAIFSESLDSQGVAPFGEVVEGMEVVDIINAEYGGEPEVPMILKIGNRYLQQNYPNLTMITSCRFESASDSEGFIQLETNPSELEPVKELDTSDAVLDLSQPPADAPMCVVYNKTPATDTPVASESKPQQQVEASTPTIQPGAGLNAQVAPEDENDADIEGMLGDLEDLDIPADFLLGELDDLDIPLDRAE
jgi:hypothetical protein